MQNVLNKMPIACESCALFQTIAGYRHFFTFLQVGDLSYDLYGNLSDKCRFTHLSRSNYNLNLASGIIYSTLYLAVLQSSVVHFVKMFNLLKKNVQSVEEKCSTNAKVVLFFMQSSFLYEIICVFIVFSKRLRENSACRSYIDSKRGAPLGTPLFIKMDSFTLKGQLCSSQA